MTDRNGYCALGLWIGGRMLAGEGRTVEPVLNPATGEVLGELPHATPADLDAAIQAASAAFHTWRKTSPLERSAILRTAAGLIRERTDHIATVMTLEQGKPLAEAKGELAHSTELFEWYAEEGRRVYGRIVPARNPDVRQFVYGEPVGPCTAFTPWNFPALTPARKLAAALGAGCSLILKAAEETPGCAVEIVRALHDAGLPAGCAQLVFGVPDEVSRRLIAAREIRKVSFTGSTPVGIHLMKLAAEGVKRVTMELGGNAPVIVFADADFEEAASLLAAAKVRNAGQVCISPARFFVHESIGERFATYMTERFGAMKVASGLDPEVDMGPLANNRRIEAMEHFLADAQRGGGKVLTGGTRPSGPGYFFRPSVITDLAPDAMLLSSECFGPIMPIVPFATDEEAIRLANDVDAGLAAYAFTRDLKRARFAGAELKAGMIGINSLAISSPETPFGGVKASGSGSEGGIEGLLAYLDTKLVTEA